MVETAQPRWRPRSPLASAITIGLVCLVAAAGVLASLRELGMVERGTNNASIFVAGGLAATLRLVWVARRNRAAGHVVPWKAEMYGLLALFGSIPVGIVASVVCVGILKGFERFERPPEGYVRVGAQNPVPGLFVIAILGVSMLLALGLVVRPLQRRLANDSLAGAEGGLDRFGCLGILLGVVVGFGIVMPLPGA